MAESPSPPVTNAVTNPSWERVKIARHPKRPYTLDYLQALVTDFEELHGDRLQMMMERTIDTTARGVIYETFGAHGARGEEIVVRMADKNEIPYFLVDVDPASQEEWVAKMHEGIDLIVSADRAEIQKAALGR